MKFKLEVLKEIFYKMMDISYGLMVKNKLDNIKTIRDMGLDLLDSMKGKFNMVNLKMGLKRAMGYQSNLMEIYMQENGMIKNLNHRYQEFQVGKLFKQIVRGKIIK